MREMSYCWNDSIPGPCILRCCALRVCRRPTDPVLPPMMIVRADARGPEHPSSSPAQAEVAHCNPSRSPTDAPNTWYFPFRLSESSFLFPLGCANMPLRVALSHLRLSLESPPHVSLGSQIHIMSMKPGRCRTAKSQFSFPSHEKNDPVLRHVEGIASDMIGFLSCGPSRGGWPRAPCPSPRPPVPSYC